LKLKFKFLLTALLPLIVLAGPLGCAKKEAIAPSPASENKVAPGTAVPGHSAEEMKKLQESDVRAANLGPK
jgi:hypothetical protein